MKPENPSSRLLRPGTREPAVAAACRAAGVLVIRAHELRSSGIVCQRPGPDVHGPRRWDGGLFWNSPKGRWKERIDLASLKVDTNDQPSWVRDPHKPSRPLQPTRREIDETGEAIGSSEREVIVDIRAEK